jgi:predicted lipoprotein with Yx(FWY)xxD motif
MPDSALNPAAAPITPAEVSVMIESGRFVFRTTDSRPFYVFDADAPGVSGCDTACAAARPPLAAPAGAKPVGAWSPIRRADGSMQWAYKNRPVHTYAADGPGEIKGIGGGWRVLQP